MNKTNRRYWGLLGCVLAAVAISVLTYAIAPLFTSWENLLLDWHLRQSPARENREKIVLILGGDRSMIELDSWPWPRETHAQLIAERLQNAKVVAYDVFLVDKTSDEQDRLLAQAIEQHGNVVLGNAYRSDGMLLQPLEPFRSHAATGFFNFYPDSDFVVRRYTVAKRIDHPDYTEFVPSFVLSVLEAVGFEPMIDSENRLHLLSGGQTIPLDSHLNAFKLPMRGSAYPVYEFADVLNGSVPAEVFEDAIVFVGISATGASDIVHTSTGYTTGTRAMTDVFYALVSGGMPRQPAAIWQLAFSAVIIAAALFGILLLPDRVHWMAIPLSVLGSILASHVMFRFSALYFQAAALCFVLIIGGFLYLFYLRAMRENKQKQETLMGMITCLVAAIDAKDPVTAGHSQRVSEVAVQIAQKKRMRKKDIENIRFAGLIHDIGKIGISDSVLNKPGKFTPEEFEEMKKHPDKGASIMEPIHLPAEVVAGIRDHHERPDGKGYPSGKKAGELHLFAEIIKIADVYDALSSKRQYKDPWPMDKVCSVLHEGRGTEFNAELIDLFLEYLRVNNTPGSQTTI